MSVRLTHAALRALDRVNRALLPKSKKAEHLQTGKKGEEEAYFYLRKLGYVMVARNWRSPRRKGELDLVGWDGDMLCFIEVKTRTTLEVAPAEAAVDANKQQELMGMAQEYLRLLLNTSRPKGGTPAPEKISGNGSAPSLRSGCFETASSGGPKIRFDVLSIYYLEDCGKTPRFALFKNCFSMA